MLSFRYLTCKYECMTCTCINLLAGLIFLFSSEAVHLPKAEGVSGELMHYCANCPDPTED